MALIGNAPDDEPRAEAQPPPGPSLWAGCDACSARALALSKSALLPIQYNGNGAAYFHLKQKPRWLREKEIYKGGVSSGGVIIPLNTHREPTPVPTIKEQAAELVPSVSPDSVPTGCKRGHVARCWAIGQLLPLFQVSTFRITV